jgi:hypothetical protein
MELGLNYKLPLHPMHIGPSCGHEDPVGLDATTSSLIRNAVKGKHFHQKKHSL